MKTAKKVDNSAGLCCPDCKKELVLNKFLKRVESFNRATISGVSKCPSCDFPVEFQVRNNRITVGRTFFSGTLQFEAFYDVEARGLKCVRDKDGIRYIYKGVFYKVPMKQQNE